MKKKFESDLSSLNVTTDITVNKNDKYEEEIVIDGNKFKVKRHFVNNDTTVLDGIMDLILDYIKQVNEENSNLKI